MCIFEGVCLNTCVCVDIRDVREEVSMALRV